MAKNMIRIEFSGNPDLKEYFTRKAAGDECEVSVTFTIASVGDETVEGSLKRVELPESSESEDNEVEPDGEEPASIIMRMSKKPKAPSATENPYP